ncbi:MAG TPA: erythromycin esterase family protein [Gemmatimonadaceae bacterium]|nr:erythromycin esterase family protein [Gemmatimonadaceae bacterium]
MRCSSLVLAGALLLAAGSPTSDPYNLGFETAAAREGRLLPTVWRTVGTDYEFALDSTTRVEGRYSLRSRRRAEAGGQPSPQNFGLVWQALAVTHVRGRFLRVSGWIRTEAVTTGYARLWASTRDGNGRERGSKYSAAVMGTSGWTRVELVVPVDSAAATIFFGPTHPGNGTVWFDSLRVDDEELVRYAPPPRPAEPIDRLLRDDELRIPDADFDSHEPAPVMDWVRANAHPIRSLSATTFDDLRFLEPLLRGKRIVQLGESGHGVREFNVAKVRLIQYLHEELGYDVLAFESSLFECDRAGRVADSLDAATLMRSCIFGVWHTEELIPLFEYVKRTRATKRPLLLTGFDVQTSAPSAAARPAFLRRVVGALDTAYAVRVARTDSLFLARQYAMRQGSTAASDSLAAFYDSLGVWLRAREGALAAILRDDPAAPMLARQTAVSLAHLARKLSAEYEKGFLIRDRGMADNVDFLLDELYPGRKVMVWAHNAHIQHRGWGSGSRQGDAFRSMGTHVAERRRPEVYTVGLYMYRGSAAKNDGKPYPIPPASSGSLESILRQARWRYAFVDLARARRAPGTEWAFTSISTREWGESLVHIVPRDEYDGLLFIDRTWPPAYYGMTRR